MTGAEVAVLENAAGDMKFPKMRKVLILSLELFARRSPTRGRVESGP